MEQSLFINGNCFRELSSIIIPGGKYLSISGSYFIKTYGKNSSRQYIHYKYFLVFYGSDSNGVVSKKLFPHMYFNLASFHFFLKFKFFLTNFSILHTNILTFFYSNP